MVTWAACVYAPHALPLHTGDASLKERASLHPSCKLGEPALAQSAFPLVWAHSATLTGALAICFLDTA